MAPLEGSISVWAWDLASRARVDLVQASVAGEAFVAFSLLGAIVSSGLCWGGHLSRPGSGSAVLPLSRGSSAVPLGLCVPHIS